MGPCCAFTEVLRSSTQGGVCLAAGYTLIAIEKFDFESFCRLVQDHKATFAYVVPPVALLLSKHPAIDKYDLISLRMFTCAAAPMTRELVNAVDERIKVPIKQAYGLGEMSPGAVIQVSLIYFLAIDMTGRDVD